MPDLEHVVVSGNDAHGHKKLSDELASESDTFATAPTHAEEPAFWLYSSGSTGMPKGVRHLHSSLQATADTYASQVLGIRENDVCLSAAKLFFAYGLGNALTFPMSVGASTVLNADRPTPARMFELLNKYNPTIFYGVPTLFASMLNDEAQKNARAGARLRICTSAGEALPESVGNAWKARFGADILDGVGSTELLHIFLSNAPGDIKYGSSGRPVPGYRVRLVNEAGSEVPDGEVGELLVEAPSAAEGYWNQRSKSRQTFQGHWTYTGDKYTRDAEGRYTFCGRSDDMFKVSGIWVSPFEVESALITHPAVLEAAVVPEADPEGLLKPKAFVVLRADSQTDGLHECAEGARQAEDRPVEISALDRRGGQSAEDRDGEDSTVQVAGWRIVVSSSSLRTQGPRRAAYLLTGIREPSGHNEGRWYGSRVRRDDQSEDATSGSLSESLRHDHPFPLGLPHRRRRPSRIPHDRPVARERACHRDAA